MRERKKKIKEEKERKGKKEKKKISGNPISLLINWRSIQDKP